MDYFVTDDLRTRIAAVLVAHPDKMDGTCCGDTGLEIEVQDDWALHVADAVIREVASLAEPDPERDGQWLDGYIYVAHDAPATPVVIEQDPGSLIYVTANYARKMAAALLVAADNSEWLRDESRWLKGDDND